MWKLFVLLFSVNVTIHSSPITNPEPCRQDDSVCVTKTTNIMYKQAILGDPSLNMQNLDPMYHEKILANFATIKYSVTKTQITGFGQCEVVNSTLSLKNNKLRAELVCPFINIAGDCVVDGQLLGVVIEANGPFTFESSDYYINIDADINVTEDDKGKKYLLIKSYKFTADGRGRMKIILENLFNGHKELGETVTKFINDNAKIITDEMQGPVFQASMKKIITNLNKHLKTRPLDNLIVLD